MEYSKLDTDHLNEIAYIKVTDKHFDFVTMTPDANIWVTELFSDKIRVYRKLKGQKGKAFRDQVDVPKEKMTEFFRKVYEYIRTAEYEDTPKDNTSHKVTVYYSPYHKEVIENDLYKGHDSLHWIINRFVESTDITTFEEHMNSRDKD